MNSALNILHLEDDNADAELTQETLRGAGIECEISRVQDRAAFLAALQSRPWDLILADYRLPAFDGLAALQILVESAKETPFIFVTGAMGEDTAVETLKRGATDYVLKDHLAKLPSAVKRARQEALERERRKRAEEATQASLAAIVESSDDAILAETIEGTITAWNKAAERLYGYRKEDALGKPITILVPPDRAAEFAHIMKTIGQGGSVDRLETVRLRSDGTRVDVSVTISPTRNREGHLTGASSIARDITERKRGEAENLRLAAAVEQAADGIMITGPEGTIQYVNPAFTKMTGYASAEVLGRNPRLLKSDRHDAELYRQLWSTVLDGKTWHGEIVNRRKDGTLYTEETTITPVRDARGTITDFIAIKQDVTDRNRAQEALSASEARYRRLFETSQDGVLLVDPETGTIADANPFVVKLLGYGQEEILGKKLWEMGPFKDVAASHAAFRSLQAYGYIRYEGLPLETKSGGRIDVEFISNSYWVGEKKVIQCNIRDITERKRHEDQIRASLQEKDMLLKEIHHRVKNNLQVISSLLRLGNTGSQNGEFHEIMRESESRVRTMALIHEKLYQSKDFAHIDFGEYVRSLAIDLFRSYQPDPEFVSLSVQADRVLLGVDTAVPCALIVNELVSNCLKHAFTSTSFSEADAQNGESGVVMPPGGQQSKEGGTLDLPKRKGIVSVALSLGQNNRARLVVRDNGAGFPKSLDFRHTKSLGLQLVNTLTGQLGGTIEMRADGGTEFQIEFAA
ncbi:MAG TPA: PAS domain S-box protein [Terriglobia bacterium]|nr:PAS domain S-box protein [Terriglobia bacterium]